MRRLGADEGRRNDRVQREKIFPLLGRTKEGDVDFAISVVRKLNSNGEARNQSAFEKTTHLCLQRKRKKVFSELPFPKARGKRKDLSKELGIRQIEAKNRCACPATLTGD